MGWAVGWVRLGKERACGSGSSARTRSPERLGAAGRRPATRCCSPSASTGPTLTRWRPGPAGATGPWLRGPRPRWCCWPPLGRGEQGAQDRRVAGGQVVLDATNPHEPMLGASGAEEVAAGLIVDAGFVPVNAGRLEVAREVEALGRLLVDLVYRRGPGPAGYQLLTLVELSAAGG